jgi:hypothetical protein
MAFISWVLWSTTLLILDHVPASSVLWDWIFLSYIFYARLLQLWTHRRLHLPERCHLKFTGPWDDTWSADVILVPFFTVEWTAKQCSMGRSRVYSQELFVRSWRAPKAVGSHSIALHELALIMGCGMHWNILLKFDEHTWAPSKKRRNIANVELR